MPFHVVEQGECLSTIAARFRAGPWQAIFDHPSNADLKERRPNPNILLPGDRVFVPEPRPDKYVSRPTGRTHEFKVRASLTPVRVLLKDRDGEPFAGKKYAVLTGTQEFTGETGADGALEVKVPVHVRRLLLRAWLHGGDDPEDPDIEYELQVGHLDPVESVSGVQARLQNLGYRCEATGALDDETLAAIRQFRSEHGLSPEGEEPIDGALRGKLVHLHEGA
jgi:N-acetylmuramoyl-L-alanine amidase